MKRGGLRSVPWELAALIAATALYAVIVVRDFSGPLVARGDANYFEFLGAHLARTYRFGIPPAIDFVTNDVGYPEGTGIVFLSWCAERDLFVMLLWRAFGPGPWIQIYCALSPSIAAAGLYGLLRRDLGRAVASVVGFVGAFATFYAVLKYPHHPIMCALHWGAMSMAVDYLIVRRVVHAERIELRLLFARAALLVAIIGLDLPYVAGYPLTSFTVTAAFVAVYVAVVGRRRGYRLRDALPRDVVAEVRGHKAAFAFWTALFTVGLVFYVPFAFAIVRASLAYRFAGAGGNLWASQLRMLLPYLPGANPSSGWVHALFGDAEGVGEFSVGWAIVALGVLGAVAAKRKKTITIVLPTIITLLLCLAFHPKAFRTLHVFPWFFYNRVAGRSTVYFPLWLALVGVEYLQGIRRRPAIALATLFGVESATAYLVVRDYEPARYTPEMGAYFDAVRKAPGTALLEWPFCIAGANGVGTDDLCPYYRFLSTSYAYRRFHEKKVVGFYLSRLHPSQLESRIPYQALFSPDRPGAHHASREASCFDAARWSSFDALLRSGDFGAIQLDVDFLPTDCVVEFQRRYGPPVARAFLPGPGNVQLLTGLTPRQ